MVVVVNSCRTRIDDYFYPADPDDSSSTVVLDLVDHNSSDVVADNDHPNKIHCCLDCSVRASFDVAYAEVHHDHRDDHFAWMMIDDDHENLTRLAHFRYFHHVDYRQID